MYGDGGVGSRGESVHRGTEFTREDWEVFAEYGRTMLSAQELESSLLAWVSGDDYWPEQKSGVSQEVSREEFFVALEKLFRMTAGQLRRLLLSQRNIPEELAEELAEVLLSRNKLAHGYLSQYATERLMNPFAAQEAISHLAELRARFEDMDIRLLTWLKEDEDRKLRERGEDPEEYRAKIRREVQEEAQRIRDKKASSEPFDV